MRLVGSTEQVVDAVQDAVRDKLRVVARSGGHCLEGFVADPAVRVVIDTSLMTGVYYDPEMAAFAVEAGATLGEAYRKLFLGWGVTIPAGESPDIGVGGHVSGGAFGFLCRQHGLAADHLYGVEVVVVDEAGTARSVVATREPSDPNRDLWWAHTGGGGGNFGVVTRYWFRSPGASGRIPLRCCRRRRTRCWCFERRGTGTTSTRRPSPGWSATSGTGASATATRALPTPRCTARSFSGAASTANSR